MLFTGSLLRKGLDMKNALLFSTALIFVSATTCFAAEQRSVSGVVKSIDRQAGIVTLQNDASYPLSADAEVTWLAPGKSIDLLCNYDAGVIVDCGVGIGDASQDTLILTQAQSEEVPGLSLEEKQVDGLPEGVLPDQPTYRLENFIRSLDEK